MVSLGQWMMLANFKPKTPATARLSCCWMLALWQAHEQRFTWLKKSPVFRIQQSGSPRSISIRLAVIAFQMYEIARNSKRIWPYSSARSSKVIDLHKLPYLQTSPQLPVKRNSVLLGHSDCIETKQRYVIKEYVWCIQCFTQFSVHRNVRWLQHPAHWR